MGRPLGSGARPLKTRLERRLFPVTETGCWLYYGPWSEGYGSIYITNHLIDRASTRKTADKFGLSHSYVHALRQGMYRK